MDLGAGPGHQVAGEVVAGSADERVVHARDVETFKRFLGLERRKKTRKNQVMSWLCLYHKMLMVIVHTMY